VKLGGVGWPEVMSRNGNGRPRVMKGMELTGGPHMAVM
jgi:hypothetical protein